jgi:biotin carboxyl carrier protein
MSDRIAIEVYDYWPEDTDEDEGVVVDWFTREGRTVAAGDVLCEIQVEKASVDVLAPVDGEVVEIAVGEDEEFAHGDILAGIEG